MKEWLRSKWRAGLTYAQERPWRVLCVSMVVSLLLGALSAFLPCKLRLGLDLNGVELALGVLALASILAGFAGVVVVFALQSGSALFVSFRAEGGAVLRRAWLFLVRVSFLAAAASLLSAGAFALDLPLGARTLLFASVALSIQSALTMLWLLRLLVDAVGVEDSAQLQKSKSFGDAKDLYR
ncbi:hypothetical protein [Brachybacterium massiliense]|uniref:hypothetical protein n=1 Tax=Brachybacterium massiliense TaxID=1755098 RepID=UPI000B3BC429|nr:hypothetical protein [Brachybacterium massiliense]